jgi:FkbM family methyltransferase
MNTIWSIVKSYKNESLSKANYIQAMYEQCHARLYDYSNYLSNTNIKKIEIEDGSVIMTSRDRGIRIDCESGDFRIAPIEILNFNEYEKSETKMMENLLTDGDTFFDIGANLGWYSLNVKAAYPNSNVYSFEPIPKTYRQLVKNVELNPPTPLQGGAITLFNFGFSDESGELPFYYYPEGSGNASSVNVTERQDIQTIMCSVRTLDQFCRQINEKLDFIKCDVEGAELLVFKGGIKTIEKDKPIVFSEILRKWSAKFNYNPNEILELFKSMGYKSFTTNGLELLPCDLINDSVIETNFFFLHSEKHQNLINQYKFIAT